jgi:hypothetical protein
MSNSSPAPAVPAEVFSTYSPVRPEPRTAGSELYRTATSVCHSTVGTHGNESVSLVVAARPSAGRSPSRARKVAFRTPRRCRSGFSSGTLPLVKHGASLLSLRQRATSVALVAACGAGGRTVQPNAKVSHRSVPLVRLGHERTGGSSKTAPNPSIEGMPKRLRLLCTPHVKR